jgi:hypothetical protein
MTKGIFNKTIGLDQLQTFNKKLPSGLRELLAGLKESVGTNPDVIGDSIVIDGRDNYSDSPRFDKLEAVLLYLYATNKDFQKTVGAAKINGKANESGSSQTVVDMIIKIQNKHNTGRGIVRYGDADQVTGSGAPGKLKVVVGIATLEALSSYLPK